MARKRSDWGRVIAFPGGKVPPVPQVPPVPSVPAVPGVPSVPGVPDLSWSPAEPVPALQAAQQEAAQRRAADRVRGRISDRRGRNLENYLDQHILGPAQKNGLFLRIDRQHPKMAPTALRAPDGRPLFALGAASGADWIALLPKGAPFAYLPIEAKATEGETLLLSAFTDQQVKHLNAAMDAGQDGLVLVQFTKPLPETFAIRWSQVPWRKSGAGYSLPRIELSDTWRLRSWQCLGRVLGWMPTP